MWDTGGTCSRIREYIKSLYGLHLIINTEREKEELPGLIVIARYMEIFLINALESTEIRRCWEIPGWGEFAKFVPPGLGTQNSDRKFLKPNENKIILLSCKICLLTFTLFYDVSDGLAIE